MLMAPMFARIRAANTASQRVGLGVPLFGRICEVTHAPSLAPAMRTSHGADPEDSPEDGASNSPQSPHPPHKAPQEYAECPLRWYSKSVGFWLTKWGACWDARARRGWGFDVRGTKLIHELVKTSSDSRQRSRQRVRGMDALRGVHGSDSAELKVRGLVACTPGRHQFLMGDGHGRRACCSSEVCHELCCQAGRHLWRPVPNRDGVALVTVVALQHGCAEADSTGFATIDKRGASWDVPAAGTGF